MQSTFSPLLSILIPTWNRNLPLLGTVEKLIPQLNEHCELIILDNASDVPVKEFFAKNLSLPTGKKNSFTVIRNICNLGGGANILRCFEVSNGEWTWLLSDDDIPADNAIEKIFSEIEKIKFDGIFVNFSFPAGRHKNVSRGRGRYSLLNSLETLGSLSFISVNVYRTNKMKKGLFKGYNAIQTTEPHVAILLTSLGSDDLYCLSTEEILAKTACADSEGKWNFLKILSKMVLLPDAIYGEISRSEMKILQKKVFETHGLNSFSRIAGIFIQIIVSATKVPENLEITRFYFSQWIFRCRCSGFYQQSMKIFAIFLYYLSSKKKYSFIFLNFFLKCTGRDISNFSGFGEARREDF